MCNIHDNFHKFSRKLYIVFYICSLYDGYNLKSQYKDFMVYCMCFRIIPRVKEFLFGRSSSNKHSVTANKNSILNVREKRKLRDFRRPSRVTAHVINKNQKYSPRNLLHKIISNIENIWYIYFELLAYILAHALLK